MARRRVQAMVAVVLTLGGLGGLGACGPIAYVNQVTRKASDSVELARAAEADKYAPYWWTRATEYLHKARELAAHADFQGANRFGRLASESGDKAAAEAAIAKQDPSKRPVDFTPPLSVTPPPPVTPTAPAKDTP